MVTLRAGNSWLFFTIAALPLLACGSTSPPPSQFPTAEAAVTRLDATFAQVSGVTGKAAIDYLGPNGRVHAELAVLASGPANLRFGVTANVIGGAGEVASDGKIFQAEDKGANKYLVGPAKPCNIARITQVPLPSEELLPMLWGMRPKIDGPIKCDSIEWNGDGYYKVMMSDGSKDGIAHELHIAPTPGTWDKPYAQQNVRLLGVLGWKGSGSDSELVYRVTMKAHKATKTAPTMIGDTPGLDPDVPPSGPDVTVEIPWKIHIEVPAKKSDVIFEYSEAALNPPLPEGAFHLNLMPGVPVERADCE